MWNFSHLEFWCLKEEFLKDEINKKEPIMLDFLFKPAVLTVAAIVEALYYVI